MDNPFATLGVSQRYTLPVTELEQRHRDLSRALHPDRYLHAPAGERRLALERAVAVNTAFRTLRDPVARATALIALSGVPLSDADRAPPALLMDIMDLREALDAAHGDALRVAALRADGTARISRAESVIARVFDTEARPTASDLSLARESVIALRYLQRFIDEADAVAD